jgi:hypothetical protein
LAVEGEEDVVVEGDPPVCAVVVDRDEGVGRSAD